VPVVITGANSAVNTSFFFDIGFDAGAQGTVLVQNGGQLASGGIALGDGSAIATGWGQLTVTGPGSKVAINSGSGGQLTVGLGGNGTMSLLSGATATGSFYVGGGDGIGMLSVDGQGTHWDYAGGGVNNGTITITNGAVMNGSANGNTSIGSSSTTNTMRSYVLVDASSITGASFISVGSVPGAVMAVQHGGVVVCGGLGVSSSTSTPKGTVTVDGPTSSITINNGGIGVGGTSSPGGQGLLVISNGASVSQNGGPFSFTNVWPLGRVDLQNGNLAPRFLINQGSVTGNGSISLAGGGTMINTGFIDPGHSVGALTILGKLQQTNTGHIKIEITGDASFDTLTVNDATTLQGFVDFAFLYTPSSGLHTYHFLDAPSITSTAGFTVTGLDPSIVTTDFANGSFSVNIAPEASTVGILGLGFLWTARRRRSCHGVRTQPYAVGAA